LNKIKICSISIPICLVFVSLFINSSYAQSVDNFKTYTNNDLKFSIQHPSNWQIKETDETVLFDLTGRSLPIFAVNTEKAETHLDSDTLTLRNISLQELAEHELNEMTASEFRNFDLIKQNKVTIGGNDGWKLEFAEDSLYLLDLYYCPRENICSNLSGLFLESSRNVSTSQ
jgi:hypothetical protein